MTNYSACERVQAELPEYWAASLSETAQRDIEAHLRECAACQRSAAELGRVWADLDRVPAPEPGSNLRVRFYDMLDAYRSAATEETPRGKSTLGRAWWPWAPAWAFAASLLVAVGFWAGRAIPASAPGGGGSPQQQQQASANEVAQLRGEVTRMQQMMALALLQQQNAADRMRGVSYAYRADAGAADPDVVAALLETAKSDPSVNVRLAAVDAFRKLPSNESARRALLQSLKTQDSPLVQIAIIELLVDLNDRVAASRLKEYSQDAGISQPVQSRAAWAVTQLH